VARRDGELLGRSQGGRIGRGLDPGFRLKDAEQVDRDQVEDPGEQHDRRDQNGRRSLLPSSHRALLWL